MLPRLPFARRAAFAVVLFAAALAAHAQSSMKIGVLDFKQVTDKSTAIQAMIAKAEAPLSAQKDKIDAKTQDYQQRKAKLDARRSVLSVDDIKAEEDALNKMYESIQDMQYDVNKQYEKLDKEVMQPAVDRIMQVVQEIAKKEGYDLVVPSEMALYHTEKIDLTPLVIQTLDREADKLPNPAMPTAGAAGGSNATPASAPKPASGSGASK